MEEEDGLLGQHHASDDRRKERLGTCAQRLERGRPRSERPSEEGASALCLVPSDLRGCIEMSDEIITLNRMRIECVKCHNFELFPLTTMPLQAWPKGCP